MKVNQMTMRKEQRILTVRLCDVFFFYHAIHVLFILFCACRAFLALLAIFFNAL